MPRATRGELLLALPALLLLAVLAYEVVLRVAFPWDYWIWSESPFVTNMMKLSAGLPIYSSPADANSFIYSPGPEYVTYALLRPLGLALDVRACRCVVVLVGLAAAAIGAWAGSLLSRSLRPRRGYSVLAFALGALVLFKGYTADVCHPDNFHIAHATVTFALCLAAIAGNRFGLGVVAVAWAATGVLAKQTAAAGVVGALLSLAALRGRDWGAARMAIVTAVAVVVLALSFAVLVVPEYARFFTLEVPMAEPILRSRAAQLLDGILYTPYRLALLLLVVPSAASLGFSGSALARRYLVVWALVGAAEVLTSVLGYLKLGGGYNNLRSIEFWITLIAIPVLWHLVFSPEPDRYRRWIRGAAVGVTLLLTAAAVPTRVLPSRRHYAFGMDLERSIRDAVDAGERRILLAHGAMPLIRSGLTDPPLDRSNSMMEMQWARRPDFPATTERLREKYYDRVYIRRREWGYGSALIELLEANYREVAVIPGYAAPSRGRPGPLDVDFGPFEALPHGFQDGLMADVRVLERRR